jgi:hypothetical protein
MKLCRQAGDNIYFTTPGLEIFNKPTERESFWIEKLNAYVPLGLNLREEY